MFRHSFNCYLIERIKRENELQNIDKNQWYQVNLKCLPEELADKFYESHYDQGTKEFITDCYQKSDSFIPMLLCAIARAILKIFISSTSICGLLGCGSMFVFSEEQFRNFFFAPSSNITTTAKRSPNGSTSRDYYPNCCQELSRCPGPGSTYGTTTTTATTNTTTSNNNSVQNLINVAHSQHKEHCQQALSEENRFLRFQFKSNQPMNYTTLLDLGAGDGNVTSMMAVHFRRTYTTEISRFMRSRLLKRGYHLLEIDNWYKNNIKFDLISCLNVLDRCDRPIEMLTNIHRCLVESGGQLLLALVFPLSQYVEYKANHRPEEYLPIEGGSFEHQVSSFYRNVLIPCGFELVRWTKLPYLCEGNMDLTYFWLIDAVFLLKPSGGASSSSSSISGSSITIGGTIGSNYHLASNGCNGPNGNIDAGIATSSNSNSGSSSSYHHNNKSK